MRMENSTSQKPESGSSSSPQPPKDARLRKLLQRQREMVMAWEDQSGLQSGTAALILGMYQEPMTKELFLHEEGYEMSPSLMEDSPELLEELPEWYQSLPEDADDLELLLKSEQPK